MYFTIAAKSLAATLTELRKHANVKTGENWLESSEHKFGSDSVLIRATDPGTVTLYAYSNGRGDTGTHSSFLRLDTVNVENGSLAVPFRVLHDYVKTFSAGDMLTIESGHIVQVIDTPAERTRQYDRATGKYIVVDTPATYRDEHSIIITCGRNRARMIARTELAMPFAFRADSYELASPVAKATTHAAFNTDYYPVSDDMPVVVSDHQVATPAQIIVCSYDVAEQPAVILGPAYVAPLGNPPGLRIDPNDTDHVARGRWARYCHAQHIAQNDPKFDEPGMDDSDAIVNAIVTMLTGEQPAPTPIRAMPAYTAAVGDTVSLTYNHENGTTTDRVVTIHRMTASGFRGYDHTYHKARNYHFDHISRLTLHTGEEDLAAG